MNIEKYLPIAAPAPAGVVIAAQMWREVFAALGAPSASNQPTYWSVVGISSFVAFCGGFALIGCEMQAYKYAGLALAEGNKRAAALCLLFAILCTIIVVWAVAALGGSPSLMGAVLVAVAAYVVRAIREHTVRTAQKSAQSRAEVEKDQNFQLAMAKQITAQKQAEARAAKVVQPVPQPPQPVAQPQPTVPQPVAGKIDHAQLVATLSANPNKTHAQLGKLFGVSSAAVGKHIKKFGKV